MRFRCSNCKVMYSEKAIGRMERQWPNIPGLAERCEPGGIVPAAECRICGSLIYPIGTVKEATEPASVLPIAGYGTYTVLLHTGGSDTYLEPVQVLLAIPVAERPAEAAKLAREKFCGDEGMDYDEATAREEYPVIAIFEGDVSDISQGDE